MRALLDLNVYVSYLLLAELHVDSPIRQTVELGLSGFYTLLTTPALFQELDDVSQRAISPEPVSTRRVRPAASAYSVKR